ncbi:hypothetical protein [Nesterenkonia pannonica]|uniref:hypothetical protein n=1 Tax=Nesterenkonia pannonica TaxID=1548602 RepID=UPI002164A5DA|nr:hypothetical protein [Nesterenkonia pannonica]
MLSHTRLVLEEDSVHGEDGVLGQLVGEREGGFHGSDVADDGASVGSWLLLEVGEGELLGAGCELFDFGAGGAFGAQQGGGHGPDGGAVGAEGPERVGAEVDERWVASSRSAARRCWASTR